MASEHLTRMKGCSVDGSAMEGGGQVLRCSMAISALTGRPVRVFRIRGGRPKPGLANQHLAGIRLVAEMCGGDLEGASLRAAEVAFTPGALTCARPRHEVAMDTAGSVALVLQAAVPCAALSGREVAIEVVGGTDVPFSPPADFVLHVLEPSLRRLAGIEVRHTLHRRGYMPRGGGRIEARVRARVTPLAPFSLCERGEVAAVRIFVAGAGRYAGGAAAAAAAAARDAVRCGVGAAVAVEVATAEAGGAEGDALSVLAVAETTTGALLSGNASETRRKGSIGKVAAAIAGRAAENLARELLHGGCVCEHLQDQLLVFMALAGGVSRMRCGPLSLHSCTAMVVAERVSGGEAVFRVRSADDSNGASPWLGSAELEADPRRFAAGGWLVECQGAGVAPHASGAGPAV